MTHNTVLINGVRVPVFLYGTAWKEGDTQRLTELALKCGFRGIDTANQRRHYFEAGVGAAVSSAIRSGLVTREELFLQTKFTFRPGQDHRLPYDPAAPIETQVQQSFASSLEHLGVNVIDSYVLHGPSTSRGLTAADLAAWKAMEELCDSGKTRLLGISNVSLEQLDLLCQKARRPPQMVQNRCFAAAGWDGRIREYCRRNGIVYQGFSLLTANASLFSSSDLQAIARKYERNAAQVLFRFALQVGMIALTGTKDEGHMRADLSVFDFELSAAELHWIENAARVDG